MDGWTLHHLSFPTKLLDGKPYNVEVQTHQCFIHSSADCKSMEFDLSKNISRSKFYCNARLSFVCKSPKHVHLLQHFSKVILLIKFPERLQTKECTYESFNF